MIYDMLSCAPEALLKNIANPDFLRKVTGSFSCYRAQKACRDPLGMSPLYYAEQDGKIVFAHSKKELFKCFATVKDFPPGYCYANGFRRYYDNEYRPQEVSVADFKQHFKDSVAAVTQNTETAVLLSGGIDSAALLLEAAKINLRIEAVTVGVNQNAPDIISAAICANALGIKHHIFTVDEQTVINLIPRIIRNIESWNYSLVRNSIPTFLAMSYAKKLGNRLLLTGDCADGILAGQPYLWDFKKQKEKIFRRDFQDIYRTEIRRMQNQATALHITVRSPYLYLPFTEYVMSIPLSQKISVKENKIILRKAYENELPQAGRQKMPIGSGAGFDFLNDYFERLITDEEFSRLKELYRPIKFISKEHLYYFRIWKELFFPKGNNYECYWQYGSYGSWEFYYK